MEQAPVREPGSPRRVRIACVAGRYLIFDVADVLYLRRNHNICSVFVGTLPQNPSQNLFMGLPVELFPEEARLLVCKGVAYVVDNRAAHLSVVSGLQSDDPARARYIGALRSQQNEVREAMAAEEQRRAGSASASRREKPKEKKTKKKGSADDVGSSTEPALVAETANEKKKKSSADEAGSSTGPAPTPSEGLPAEEETHFSAVRPEGSASVLETGKGSKHGAKPPADPTRVTITPTTSAGLVELGADADALLVHDVPVSESYALYAHLHDRGFYIIPGLRFGTHYSVYPGDPFRFHAHFQATSYGWEEEMPLLDLVTAGRLVTTVKKSLLIGGRTTTKDDDLMVVTPVSSGVRTFCLEWAQI